jgi:hypothetical protein
VRDLALALALALALVLALAPAPDLALDLAPALDACMVTVVEAGMAPLLTTGTPTPAALPTFPSALLLPSLKAPLVLLRSTPLQ